MLFSLIHTKEALLMNYDNKIVEKIDRKNNFFKCYIAYISKKSLIMIEF